MHTPAFVPAPAPASDNLNDPADSYACNAETDVPLSTTRPLQRRKSSTVPPDPLDLARKSTYRPIRRAFATRVGGLPLLQSSLISCVFFSDVFCRYGEVTFNCAPQTPHWQRRLCICSRVDWSEMDAPDAHLQACLCWNVRFLLERSGSLR